MKHRVFVSFALSASLLVSSSSFADGPSGIIYFSGMIIETPCSFEVDAVSATQLHLHPNCPRPITGLIAFVDAASQRSLKTALFTHASRAIAFPDRTGNKHTAMIAVVTYQ
ncbi:hypothetical protein WT25_20285 [Burkholderia territorii]|uniref:hypothetical protein n=1 Tax=Burkholderia territorii TaxID=1503055 RepID=UPI00075DB918|nr:hypothetical protein [Burkholderia territorii]KVT78874.1 hypothetical protein WT25_20285 [Burkholderia territorii]